MPEPDDLVDLEVPAEQLREGDVLLVDGVEHHVDRFLPDVVPEYVYAFVPEQLPIPRRQLVAVRRPRSATTLGRTSTTVDPQEFAEVRDLALALGDLARSATPDTVGRVKRTTDRVRTRLEATTDGTAGPDAPVLGVAEPVREPAAAPAPVVPPVRPGAAKGGR